MENFNDPRNMMGMGAIYLDEDEDLDIEDIEKSIISGIPTRKDEKPVDIAKEYDKELEALSKQFNLGSFSGKAPDLDDDDDGDINNLLNWSPYDKPSKSAAPSSGVSFSLSKDDDDDEEESGRDESAGDKPAGGVHSSWSASRPTDEYLHRMTNEERKQKHINSVLGKMERVDDDSAFIQQEEEEDEMARIIEQIDLLRTNLESEGVDLSRIKEVDSGTSKKEAKAVLRILQIKNDRLRYCDMFEEGILAVAYGLESVFDGKKEYFGTKIDLVGWPESVNCLAAVA